MEPGDVLKLFDSFWSEREFFIRKHEVSTPPANLVHQRIDESEESMFSGVPTLRIRSDDRCLGLNGSNHFFNKKTKDKEASSPTSVIDKESRLKKILYGKEGIEFTSKGVRVQEKIEKSREKKSCSSRRVKGRKGMCRSSSVLEFDEVKGFVVLKDKGGISSWRIHSRAWGDLNTKTGCNAPLMNCRFPSAHNEVETKRYLRVWAQIVASSIR